MDHIQVDEAVRVASRDIPVGPPPTREIVAGGVRRRRRRRAGAAALAGCAVLTAGALIGLVDRPFEKQPTFAAQDDLNSTPSASAASTPSASANALTRAGIDAYLEELPGVALVLPAKLPFGYRWDGPSAYETSDEGQAIVRSSTFTSVRSPADEAAVEVCAHTAQGRTCPQGATRFTRTVDGVDVIVSFSRTPSAQQRQFWEDAPLTLGTDVPWLN